MFLIERCVVRFAQEPAVLLLIACWESQLRLDVVLLIWLIWILLAQDFNVLKEPPSQGPRRSKALALWVQLRPAMRRNIVGAETGAMPQQRSVWVLGRCELWIDRRHALLRCQHFSQRHELRNKHLYKTNWLWIKNDKDLPFNLQWRVSYNGCRKCWSSWESLGVLGRLWVKVYPSKRAIRKQCRKNHWNAVWQAIWSLSVPPPGSSKTVAYLLPMICHIV